MLVPSYLILTEWQRVCKKHIGPLHKRLDQTAQPRKSWGSVPWSRFSRRWPKVWTYSPKKIYTTSGWTRVWGIVSPSNKDRTSMKFVKSWWQQKKRSRIAPEELSTELDEAWINWSEVTIFLFPRFYFFFLQHVWLFLLQNTSFSKRKINFKLQKYFDSTFLDLNDRHWRISFKLAYFHRSFTFPW